MTRRCPTCDPSVVIVAGRRYQRLDHKGKPEADASKGCGFVLLDKPVHAKRREGRK